MKWFDVELAGQIVVVEIVPKDDPRLENNYGISIHEESLILLSNELKGDALLAYCVHELLHHVDFVSGADFELSEHCEATNTDHAVLDERLTRYRTPTMLGLLRRLGVKFPPFPEGFGA